MKRLYYLPLEAAMDAYRETLTSEFLGWVIFAAPGVYTPVHRVRMDPMVGPVIIAGDEVYEVDSDADVFWSEDAARDAYWERKSQ